MWSGQDNMLYPSYFIPWEGPFPQIIVKEEEDKKNSPILHVYLQKKKISKEVEITQQDLLKYGYEIKKRRWSQAEDEKLIALAKDGEIDWEKIAMKFADRTAKMCYNRFRRLENSVRRSWTEEDDQRIIELISKVGDNWKIIKQYFPEKTEKQLKDHYSNYLRPDLDFSNWTLETDMKFVNLLSQYGCDWTQIQKHMPERPYPHIKNRYYGRIAKIIAEKLKDDL